MYRFRFWFDDTNYGVSCGNTAVEAFEFFKEFGFDESDVENIETEINL